MKHYGPIANRVHEKKSYTSLACSGAMKNLSRIIFFDRVLRRFLLGTRKERDKRTQEKSDLSIMGEVNNIRLMST